MRAIFLDRDGVINHNIFYKDSQEWESPRNAKDLNIIPDAIEAMRLLKNAGFLLFIVSNQPSYAKGKTSLEDLYSVHSKLEQHLKSNNIIITATYYCYHHPHGIIPSYTKSCQCRKPSPFFLLEAKKTYGLDMPNSWMIGDRDTDIACGQAAGTKTIKIIPDYLKYFDLKMATATILGVQTC